MQNCTFLVLLRPIFCEKLKIAPPQRKTAPPQTFEFPISAEKSVSISVKTFFFNFFGDHLIFGGKNVWISELSEKFRLNFRTNRVKLIQEQWKFGSRSFALFSLFQKSPPLFQILATRLPWLLHYVHEKIKWGPEVAKPLNFTWVIHLNWLAETELKGPGPLVVSILLVTVERVHFSWNANRNLVTFLSLVAFQLGRGRRAPWPSWQRLCCFLLRTTI